jgi:uncharacterized tellurite resistance protein B-like protein
VLEAIRSFVRERLAGPEHPAAAGKESTSPSRVQLAACALLLELAYADDEFSPAERQHIEGTLKRHFGLDEATAAELIRLAEAERAQALDHFQFTRLVVAEYDLSQKVVLAEIMWGVILADGRLSDHETHLVRKMASLMEVEPAYLSQARRAAAAEGARSRGP